MYSNKLVSLATDLKVVCSLTRLMNDIVYVVTVMRVSIADLLTGGKA